jgi:AbrB family looped-hinge helix DNA binding protein
MDRLEVTTLSTKGQVVIPQRLRDTLGLQPGDKFVAVGEADTVVLKRLTVPRHEDYQDLIRHAEELAEQRKLTKRDVERAIRKVRGR